MGLYPNPDCNTKRHIGTVLVQTNICNLQGRPLYGEMLVKLIHLYSNNLLNMVIYGNLHEF